MKNDSDNNTDIPQDAPENKTSTPAIPQDAGTPEDNDNLLVLEQDSLSPASEEPQEDGDDDIDSGNEEDQLHDMFTEYFIEYASYVVKDRAIPDVDDGLKPVQRRILHCLNAIDDGRFNRVASVVGDTMHYHPHGDQSIAGALTVLANKEYFIERQGNFGNILTGDPAAAPRYIECRLTQLARETMFNKELTEFVPSYDGRSEEPVRLPAKVPALLLLGTSGIAVGMATEVFPHNFNELLDAQIAILENREFQVFPDFIQGGIMDVSEYADGTGRIRLRARIEPDGDKKIVIREIPASTTTEQLIDSIENATKKGKLKIQSINDYTTDKAAIEIVLPRGIYAEDTIRELYAYTDCEVSIKSTLRVICEEIPVEMTVSQVLRRNTQKLTEFLKKELELQLQKLENQFHDKTLAQIFIENRIYKRIEKSESMESIFKETRKGLEPFINKLRRKEISDEDIEKLLQIPIRRISLFDIRKNETELAKIIEDIESINNKLNNIVGVTIDYIRTLKEKYGSQFPRHTEISTFDVVKARDIARKDIKVYHDKVNHFVGTKVNSSSKDGAPIVCTEFDRLVLLRNDGSCRIIPVCEKEYIGPTKYVMLADKSQFYSIIYRDKATGVWYAKRFSLGQYTLGKEYHIVPSSCFIEELYTNTGVVVDLKLKANVRRSYNSVTVDFNQPLFMRSREARGIKLTNYEVIDIEVTNRGTKPDKTVEPPAEAETPADVPAPPAPVYPEPAKPDTALQPEEPTESVFVSVQPDAENTEEQPTEQSFQETRQESQKPAKKSAVKATKTKAETQATTDHAKEETSTVPAPETAAPKEMKADPVNTEQSTDDTHAQVDQPAEQKTIQTADIQDLKADAKNAQKVIADTSEPQQMQQDAVHAETSADKQQTTTEPTPEQDESQNEQINKADSTLKKFKRRIDEDSPFFLE